MNPEGFLRAHNLLVQGRIQAAQDAFNALLTESEADALNGLGLCAESLGQLIQAEDYYRQAIDLNPDEAEFYNNLAICLFNQGRADAGLKVMRELAQNSSEPEVLYNLVLGLISAQLPWEALDLLKDFLDINPRQGSPIVLLIELVDSLAYQPDSLQRLRDLLAASPNLPAYHLALGAWYATKGEAELAIRYFRSALLSNPKLLGAYRHLILQYQSRGQYARALDASRRMFASEASLESLVELVITLQHPIPNSEEQIQSLRQELLGLLESFGDQDAPVYLRERDVYVPSTLPFYHTYQSGEDLVIQRRLAAFFSRFLTWEQLDWVPNPRPRIGIFSTHLFKHSVMDLLLRAVEKLLQSPAFESYLFFYPAATTSREDEITEKLKELADHFFKLPDDLRTATRVIAEQNLDILIYLDVGMETYSYSLAINRLAKYQMVLPGHPVTTGSRSIDYFVSSEWLEHSQSDELYSEKLVRLPGLPDYAKPADPPLATRQELQLPNGNLYFCPMTIFKMLPAYDDVIAGILRQDPNGKILMLQFRNKLHLELQARFTKKYPDLAERLIFLSWSRQPLFFQRLKAVDVILDTFPFGGGNTSYQAFGLGCPMVCLDVPWQKGRWTQAMYRYMEIDELIAKTPEEYIELAIRLATDKSWQAEMREKIQARSQILFDNPTWSQGLLEFCLDLVR